MNFDWGVITHSLIALGTVLLATILPFWFVLGMLISAQWAQHEYGQRHGAQKARERLGQPVFNILNPFVHPWSNKTRAELFCPIVVAWVSILIAHFWLGVL